MILEHYNRGIHSNDGEIALFRDESALDHELRIATSSSSAPLRLADSQVNFPALQELRHFFGRTHDVPIPANDCSASVQFFGVLSFDRLAIFSFRRYCAVFLHGIRRSTYLSIFGGSLLRMLEIAT